MSDPATTTKPKGRMGGKRPGAGGPFKPLNDKGQAILKSLHPALRRNLARLKTLGATNRQVIFELHARQGRSITEVAQIMGLSYHAVYAQWELIKADVAANAPTTAEQFTAIREVIDTHLQNTIEATYAKAEIVDEKTGETQTIEMPANPQMLAIRLKALDQRAKLYGVNLEQQAQDTGQQPYSAPDEIASEVRQKILELHQRPTSLLSPPQQLP